MIEVLCQAGADVNYQRTEGITPLFVSLEEPDTLRALLRFGADPSIRVRSTLYQSSEPEKLNLLEEAALFKAGRNINGREVEYFKSARLLWNARLLRPRLRGVFALRALIHRGRAVPTSETPEVVARLVGGSLPDPLAHLVCKFWLGEPPRRRRRSE